VWKGEVSRDIPLESSRGYMWEDGWEDGR